MAGSITLVGMMGAGKSAVGAELARRLGWPFLDSDTEIEAAAAMTVPEIFARDGEAFFRDRESEVIARLLAGPPCVLATGGGAWMRPANRDTIRKAGTVVWLNTDVDTLWHRLRGRSGRPLLETGNPRETLLTMLDGRRATYAEADLCVPIGIEDSIASSTEAVLKVVAAARPDILEAT